MDLHTLNKKRIENGKVIMTEPVVLFNNVTDILGSFVVDSQYAGRIDLIALQVYGSASKADYILKYNGISNPFSIEDGDVLLIPYPDVILSKWNNKPSSKTEAGNTIRDKFLNTKRLTTQDQKRIEYLKRKADMYENGASEILPPNVLKTGKTNVVIANGVLSINGPSDK